MKIIITLMLITLTTFSGVPGIVAQKPVPILGVFKATITPMQKKTDSLRKQYYEQISVRDSSTDLLIAKAKTSENENAKLHAEIKYLKKVNHFLRKNIDTVYIHDTVFKKRKFYQLFKK